MGSLNGLWRRLRGSTQPLLQAEAPTRLVVGLGNPGEKYAATRHNAGFRVLETWASRRGACWRLEPALRARIASFGIAAERVLLLQPQTFMNRSGESVERALERWPQISPARDLIVVFDDLDLPVGRIRLRPAGGSGGHRGLGDILDRLETKQLPRLRFGIGHPGKAAGVLEWVLQPFDEGEEREVLGSALVRAADALETLVCEDMTAAMGRFNAPQADLVSGR